MEILLHFEDVIRTQLLKRIYTVITSSVGKHFIFNTVTNQLRLYVQMCKNFCNAEICRIRRLIFQFLFQILKSLLAHSQPFFNQVFKFSGIVLVFK